jgi:hypothetical protein
MSINTQPRQPSGTPVGGQFAGKDNPEPSIDIDPMRDEVPPEDGCDVEPEHPVFNSPDGVRTLWGTDGGFRFFDGDGRPVTPVFETTDDGVRWARSHGWPSEEPLTGAQLYALDKTDLNASDLQSSTRDLRMAARSAVGDLAFIDPSTGKTELLSNAYVLANHVADVDPRRVFCHEDAVTVNDRVVPWSDLSSSDQLDYIRGYAMQVGGAAYQADEGPAFDAGWVRGGVVSRAAALLDAGVPESATVTVIDPDAAFSHRVLVDHVEPDPYDPISYRAQVAAGQHRRHQTPTGGSRTVPWSSGTPIQFRVDAIAAP